MDQATPEFSLLLPDEVLIVALDSDKGAFSAPKHLDHMLAAAMLLELALQERLTQDGRASFLITNSSPSGHDLMDEALQKLSHQISHRFIKYWIAEPEAFQDLSSFIFERLGRQGLLVREERRSMMMFSSEHWTWTAPDFKDALLESFMAGADGSNPTDARSYCLIKLLRSCPGMISHITDPEDWEGVPEPILAEGEILDVALVENICSILRGVIHQK